MVTIRSVHGATGEWAEFVGCPDSPLLDQMEQHCPFEVPFMCSMGACGSCAVSVLEGEQWLDAGAFSVGCSAEAPEKCILPCVAGVRPESASGPPDRRVVLELR
ncbi:MAG: 2Fe-2S iron-sulfur cluster-binding protein [Actinomycetota bacterium]